MEPMTINQYVCTMDRDVDGDTLWLNIDLGFRVTMLVDVRLAHLDTPEVETYTLQGLSEPGMDYVRAVLPPGAVCVATITREEKYGRWLADILYLPGVTDPKVILQTGRDLNNELLQKGLAKPYEGGKKD
jgi:endonuclease YncB( thermonuclease family)